MPATRDSAGYLICEVTPLEAIIQPESLISSILTESSTMSLADLTLQQIMSIIQFLDGITDSVRIDLARLWKFALNSSVLEDWPLQVTRDLLG